MSRALLSVTAILIMSIGSIGQYREYKLDPRWKRIRANDEAVVSYDSKSLSSNPPSTVKAWIRFDYSPEARAAEVKSRAKAGQSIKGYDKFVYRLYFWEFNCATQEQCLLRQIDYAGTGSVLSNIDFKDMKRYTPITPDTLGEVMLEKVCEAARTQ